MELAKKRKDPAASVCPELSNHEIFEKWRIVKTSALRGDDLEKFKRHKAESQRRYDLAFASVLSHTSKSEWDAFWLKFRLGIDLVHTNPIAKTMTPTTKTESKSRVLSAQGSERAFAKITSRPHLTKKPLSTQSSVAHI